MTRVWHRRRRKRGFRFFYEKTGRANRSSPFRALIPVQVFHHWQNSVFSGTGSHACFKLPVPGPLWSSTPSIHWILLRYSIHWFILQLPCAFSRSMVNRFLCTEYSAASLLGQFPGCHGNAPRDWHQRIQEVLPYWPPEPDHLSIRLCVCQAWSHVEHTFSLFFEAGFTVVQAYKVQTGYQQ